MKSSLLYCLLVFFSISCTKGGLPEEEDHVYYDPTDTSYPTLVVNTPTDNQVFASGAVVEVTGNVSDNSIFQGSVTISRDDNGLILKQQYYEIHYIPSYNFSMSCPVSVTASTNYTVTVKFEDHGHNQTEKSVKIKVNP